MRSVILTQEVLDLKKRIDALDLNQRDILLDLVDPQPDEEPAPKAKKKSTRKSSGKSPRASNIAVTLGNRQSQEPRCVVCYEPRAHENHNVETGHEFQSSVSERAIQQLKKHELCAHVFTDDNRICDERADSAVHSDPVYTTYHEFAAPQVVAAGGD